MSTNPGFIDETGKTLAGALVLSRAENIGGKAYWRCRLACGHEASVQGMRLRQDERAGVTYSCGECRNKRGRPRKRIDELPEGQLNLLVAIAASWTVCGRPPTLPELRSVGVGANGTDYTMLTTKGLVTMEWRAGRRLRGTVQPTEDAWRQLGINAVTGSAAE